MSEWVKQSMEVGKTLSRFGTLTRLSEGNGNGKMSVEYL